MTLVTPKSIRSGSKVIEWVRGDSIPDLDKILYEAFPAEEGIISKIIDTANEIHIRVNKNECLYITGLSGKPIFVDKIKADRKFVDDTRAVKMNEIVFGVNLEVDDSKRLDFLSKYTDL